MNFNKMIVRCVVLLCLALSACSEAIDFNPAFKPSLVISSELTNKTKNFQVSVMQSTPAKSPNRSNRNDPINDANIVLYTENGAGVKTKITDDFNVNDGVYTTKNDISSSLIAERNYWIEITVADKLYRSQKEAMRGGISPVDATYEDNDIILSFQEPAATKDYYAYGMTIKDSGSSIVVRDYDENLVVQDLLFNGKEARLKFADVLNIVARDTQLSFTLKRLNSSGYTFAQKQQLQQSDLDGSSNNGGSNRLFSPPPANLTGNIYEVTSKRSVIGNFSVFWEHTFEKTGAEIGVK